MVNKPSEQINSEFKEITAETPKKDEDMNKAEISLTQGDIPRLDTGSMAEHIEDAVMPTRKAVCVPAHEIST